MELISKKIQQSSEAALWILFSIFVIIPIVFSFYQNLVDFDFMFINSLFFWVLFKATSFAFIQACLSVLAIATFSYFSVAFFKTKKLSFRAKRFFEVCGFLSFSLSPTLVALAIILLFSSLFNINPSGLAAIVFCHFIMNAAYFSSQFMKRCARYDAAEGKSLGQYLKSLGATPAQERKLLVWPVFKSDFRSWAPQVFLWCFMSFAPVVLLSSGTGQNTPELLLYYSLLNDPSGTRVFLIFLLTASISFLLTRYAYFTTKLRIPESFAHENKIGFSFYDFLIFTLSVALIFPFLFTLISPLVVGGKIDKSLLETFFPTLVVFASTFLISFVFGVLSLFCSKDIKVISYSNFISAPMILMGFLSLSLSESQSYLWISLGSVLALLPWAHRKIRSQVESLSVEHRESAFSLGMKNFSYFRYYLWPEMGPSILKISLLFSLWSLGEYTFSKAYLNRSSTLALFIEENLRRYHFAEASYALSITLLLSVIVVTPQLWKAKKNAPL